MNIKNMKIELTTFIICFLLAIYILIFAPARYFTWHAITQSPEPIAEILYASVDTVSVRTISGKEFSCNIYDKENCWFEDYSELLKGRSLWCFPEVKPTEHTIQIARACSQSHNFGILGTIYALHEDGNIYVKHKGYISLDGYAFGALFGLLCASIIWVSKRLWLRINSYLTATK